MARDAVRSRDELIGWFDTSPTAAARARQFMLIDLAGRLAEWGPIGRHRETVRGMLGLDLDAATPMEEVPRLWADARHQQLRGLPVYIMTPEMMDVCVAAAKTLTVDDVAAIAVTEPHAAGHLLLPDDLLLDHPMAGTEVEDVRALSWFDCHAGEPSRSMMGPGRLLPTTRIMDWGRTFGGLTPASHQARLDYAREVGVRLPTLTFSDENWLPPGPAVDASIRRASLAAIATDDQHKEQVAEHVRGQVIADPDSSFVKRFLAAFWRLCDQRIAVVTRPDDPAIGGTINQPAEHPDVRVITLRHLNRDGRDEPGLAVAWSHRWIVQMHKRHQWYPSQGVHKIIFVGPYIKGPEGLPLKAAPEQVRSLAR